MHTVDVLPTLVAALGGDAHALAAPGFALDGVSHWPMLSQGKVHLQGEVEIKGGVHATARQDTNRTVLLECDPYASPYSNRPPDFVCGGDEHATPYYALRQGRWKLLLGDPGADDNRHPSIGNGLFSNPNLTLSLTPALTLRLTRQWVLLHGASVPGDAQQQRHPGGALASNPNPNPSPNPNPNPNQAEP